MKILFLTDNFPPETNAPATRTYEHCIEWVKKGAEVTVITCAPNFPKGKVFGGYKNKLVQVEEMEGIKVIRVWTYISANKGTLKRILDYLSFCFSSFWCALFQKTDIIIATSPQFFTAVSGFLVSFFKRKPWVMEVRDLWPESIKAVGALKDGPMLRALEHLELFLYKNADKIIVVTEAFKENILSRVNIPAEKIGIIKNGVNSTEFFPKEANQELMDQVKLEGKFVLGYLGTHGMAHKLDFILNSIKEVPQHIHFLFIGDGAEKEKLMQLKEKLELTNVTMLPPVPKSEISKFLSIVHVALVPLKKSDAFKKVIPSKIFENAAMQIPILLGVEGESQKIVESYGAGICFEPENKEDFLEKLNQISTDKALYANLQKGCTRLAEDFDRKKLATDLYNHLTDLV